MTVRAFLGLGSNLGDRVSQIHRAITLLGSHPAIALVDTASLYETEPVSIVPSSTDDGLPIEPQWFVNTAVAIDTELTAEGLLEACLAIEKQLGRDRSASPPKAQGYSSRTLDIDLLFYDSQMIRLPSLTVPHPHLHERAFVLMPLLELIPDWKHPALGKTIRELCQALPKAEAIKLLGSHHPQR